MGNGAALLLVLVLAASCMLAPLPAKAEPRTIVVEGDWMRIQGAVSSANPGDTVFVKKGTYAEPTIVIDKSVILIGEDSNTTVISNVDTSPPWDGSFPPPPATPTIQISTDNVKISGFTITNEVISIAGNGDGTQIIGNVIKNNVEVAGSNQTIAGNRVTATFRCIGSRNNITANVNAGDHEGFTVNGSFNIVYDNILVDGVAAGGMYIYGDQNVIAGNNITNCGGGISIEKGSHNWIYANTIIHNGRGFSIGEGTNNTFKANHISEKQAVVVLGGTHLLAERNIFFHNNFVNNSQPIYCNWELLGAGNSWDNGKEGNYWSGLSNTDINGDGVGDTPFVIIEKNIDRFPLMFPWGPWDVSVSSPENSTYSGSVPLVFVVDRPVSWLGYSVDGKENVTVSGNTTLSGLAEGWHTVAVYAKDTLGNVGASEAISFFVEGQAGLQTVLLVGVAAIAAAGIGIIVYASKRRRIRPQ